MFGRHPMKHILSFIEHHVIANPRDLGIEFHPLQRKIPNSPPTRDFHYLTHTHARTRARTHTLDVGQNMMYIVLEYDVHRFRT